MGRCVLWAGASYGPGNTVIKILFISVLKFFCPTCKETCTVAVFHMHPTLLIVVRKCARRCSRVQGTDVSTC